MTYTATYKNALGKVEQVRELAADLHHLQSGAVPNVEYVEMMTQTYLAAGVSPEELEQAIERE